MKDQKVAILFFSRTPFTEAQEKHWMPQHRAVGNRAIAQLLIQHTARILDKAPFPVFHFTELQQRGNSFGERFANAFHAVFSQGFDAVIAVGNDSPHLHQVNWWQVGQSLRQGKAVVGANLRGGNYLIALNRQQFERKVFQELPWQTSGLSKALLSYLSSQQARIHTLENYRDLNTVADIWKLLRTDNPCGMQRLGRMLRRILLGLTASVVFPQIILPPTIYQSSHGLRGPPIG